MSIDKARLELLLDQAREWLDPYPTPKIELRRSSQLLIQQMQYALSCGYEPEARCFIDRLNYQLKFRIIVPRRTLNQPSSGLSVPLPRIG
jgi:hypothetical protein